MRFFGPPSRQRRSPLAEPGGRSPEGAVLARVTRTFRAAATAQNLSRAVRPYVRGWFVR
jgi:hypothetical protein